MNETFFPVAILSVWCLLISLALNISVPEESFFYVGLFFQAIEKIYYTHPRVILVNRCWYYALELLVRISFSQLITAWYWLPLDIWNETRCCGNVSPFGNMRYIKLVANRISLLTSLAAVASYYLISYFTLGYATYYYFFLAACLRQFIRWQYPYCKLDVQIGEIRPIDVKKAVKMSEELSQNFMQGIMGQFFNADEVKELQECMQEMRSSQSGTMAAYMGQIFNFKPEETAELEKTIQGVETSETRIQSLADLVEDVE